MLRHQKRHCVPSPTAFVFLREDPVPAIIQASISLLFVGPGQMLGRKIQGIGPFTSKAFGCVRMPEIPYDFFRISQDVPNLQITVDYMEVCPTVKVFAASNKAIPIGAVFNPPESAKKQKQIAYLDACISQQPLRRINLSKGWFPSRNRSAPRARPQIRVNMTMREFFSRPKLPQQLSIAYALIGKVVVCVPVCGRDRKRQQGSVRQDGAGAASVGRVKPLPG